MGVGSSAVCCPCLLIEVCPSRTRDFSLRAKTRIDQVERGKAHLDKRSVLGNLPPMKTISINNLEQDINRVEEWLAQGEEIELSRRGQPFARLLPIEPRPLSTTSAVDFMDQLRANWGDRQLAADDFDRTRELDREGDEG